MPALVVPGVRVEARFDVLPPLPSPSGIIGAVGIVDRPVTGGGLLSVSKVTELRDLLGPGTEASMPEVVHALRNGASEVVVSPVAGGAPASVDLLNANSAKVVTLRSRSNGAAFNDLAVDVRGMADAAGNIVRASLRLLRKDAVVEEFDGVRIAAGQPDDLFETINRRSRLVVATDPGFAGVEPAAGTFSFNETGDPIEVKEQSGTRTLLRLLPGDGASPSGLSVVIAVSGSQIDVRVLQGGLREQYEDLTMDPDDASYLPYVLVAQSRLLRAQPVGSVAAAQQIPVALTSPSPLTGGTSPTVQQYLDALDLLTDDPRIDTLLASIEPGRSDTDVRAIHQAMAAHAATMADNGAPRIAYGSITAAEDKADSGRQFRIRDHAAAVRGRRFVLVSPPGAEGAVAGLVARMNPQDSPTFKPIPLFGVGPARYRESELNVLLGPTINLLVAQDRPGRGVVVLKGIDTSGDQISVTRVADQAIRETKAICENFIGVLNSEDARVALRHQIIATLTRMEREGALVPSTDGKDPAFLVDVFSTQQDFAQGIVRVDIACRPVRAIDYVYATIRVKN